MAAGAVVIGSGECLCVLFGGEHAKAERLATRSGTPALEGTVTLARVLELARSAGPICLLVDGLDEILELDPAFTDVLPVDYTCDGAGHSPPLAWSGVPDGTAALAVMATTLARDGEKWNWVLFGLPSGTTGLEVDTTLGTAGLTSDGPNLAWSPPCSQGPGAKVYTFTVYALSAAPELPASPRDVTGPVLTAAIAEITLGEAPLSVSYTR